MLAALVTTLGACKRGAADAPPCAAVGAKLYALAKDALGTSALARQADDTMRRAALAQFPAMRDAIVFACTESAWSADVRRCLVDATDPLAFEACQRQLTDAQRVALDRAARGENAGDASH